MSGGKDLEKSFSFLSDNPVEEDGFSGKGHKRSAKALANAIVHFSDDDRSIGLEGAWGSGKTTVVKMAEKELEREHPNKFSFFTFDLWENQSIEFRRSFLESFLYWSKSSISNKEYKDVENRVKGKTKEIVTTSKREFSVFGYIVMSSVFFLPFLLLWMSPFSASLRKQTYQGNNPVEVSVEYPWPLKTLIEYGHWFALGLIALVVLGFIVQTIYHWCSGASFRESLDKSFSLFARKSDKDTVKQTIRDGDPTQFEFHEIFFEILSLVQRDKRRIIFVLDNIDRLSKELIQETWSNVRSIFSHDSSRVKSEKAVVTAVVPYDRAHVVSVFENTDKEETALSGVVKEMSQSTYMMEDVFRKTFSAVIAVAPPITSDLEAFFYHCLDQALPNQIDGGQRYRVFQIFDFFLTDRATNPTPRQVKSFINDVAMLVFQWKGQISVEAIAIFLLHRGKLEADPKSLQQSDTIHPRYRHFTTADQLDSELAALAYNVEPDVALEVLLERDIIGALRNPDSKHLLDLASSPGFKSQLDRILNQHCAILASSSLEDFEVALTNYSKLELEESVEELCNKHFVGAIPSLVNFDTSSSNKHEALLKIVNCFPKKSIGRHLQEIAAWARKSFPKDDELTRDQGRVWIGLIGGFIDQVSKLHNEQLAISVASEISIPYSAQFYLGVALDCDEVKRCFTEFSSIAKQKSSELSTAIGEFGKESPKVFGYVWKELHYALSGPEKLSVFTYILGEVQNNSLDEQSIREAYFENLVKVAAVARNEISLVAQLQSAIESGALPWHAFKSSELEDWRGVAHAVWLAHICLGTKSVPNLSAPNHPTLGDMNPSHAWFKKCYAGSIPVNSLERIGELVIEGESVDSWVAALAESPAHRLYTDVVIEIFGSDKCPALNFETVISCYTVLKDALSDEKFDELLARVGTEAKIDEVKQIEVTRIPPLLVSLVVDRDEPIWIALSKHIDTHLQSITSDNWKLALLENNHDRELLVARGTGVYGAIPPNNLREPLVEFVVSILSGEYRPSDSLEKYESFWLALSTTSRNGAAKSVLELVSVKPVQSEGVEIAISAFPKLFEHLPLEKKPEIAVSKLLMPLLGNGLSRTIELVSTRASVWAECVKLSPDEVVSELNDYFDGYEANEDLQPQLAELRQKLNLPKPNRSSSSRKKTEDPT
tara:strand:+ start:493 stop:4005 length:3513 start_codon:yes stop_codon:yes gene_type:complete